MASVIGGCLAFGQFEHFDEVVGSFTGQIVEVEDSIRKSGLAGRFDLVDQLLEFLIFPLWVKLVRSDSFWNRAAQDRKVGVDPLRKTVVQGFNVNVLLLEKFMLKMEA